MGNNQIVDTVCYRHRPPEELSHQKSSVHLILKYLCGTEVSYPTQFSTQHSFKYHHH